MPSISLKRFIFLLILGILLQSSLVAQIGIGIQEPDSSAQLDIQSIDKGLLIPRMSASQREAIQAPAEGLMVYDSTYGQFYFFNGSEWVNSIGPSGPEGQEGEQGIPGPAGVMVGTGPFYPGKDTLGGIVYYVYFGDDGQQHGLVVSKTESTAKWQTVPTFINALQSWSGVNNTNLMTGSPAKNYVLSLGEGWYLPSLDELNLLRQNRGLVNKALYAGGHTLLSYVYYWSSSEYNETTAWYVTFTSGFAGYQFGSKTLNNKVRGVKAF